MTFEELAKANRQIKTRNIKNKEYAEVNERIKAFRMLFPDGAIVTDIIDMHDGIVTMKATVMDADGRVLGTGTAQEKEGSTYINKTSYLENCVPIDTQILTDDGWKYYYQIRSGSKVLSLNLDTGKIEYCNVKKIHVYKNKPIVRLKTSRFESECTENHKWIVRSQGTGLYKKKTKELTTSDKIVQNVRQDVEPSVDGMKLGWLMCDCEISRTKNGMPTRAEITQSKYVDEINALFGKGKPVKMANSKWKQCYTWDVPASDVRETLSKFGISDYKDLAKAMLHADIRDVAGCYKSVMLADGEIKRGSFSSTYYELVDAVRIMCIRLGISTTFITSRTMSGGTKPIYTLGIKKGDGSYFSEMDVKKLPPRDVWCPTTENGTWFMKQGEFVTLTSNCETSAVGRALGMLGIGVDTSVASAEEVENAINGQSHGQSQEPQPYKRKMEETQDSPRRKAALQLWEARGQKPQALQDYVFKKTGKTISKKTKDSEWADILDMIKNDSSLKRGDNHA